MSETIRFDERGLVPCVVQDWATGEVLTLAYMNEEVSRATRQSGETHFYSRSRQELWHKGATSGNVQRVRQLRYDCDADAIVALVEPAGPACHTGERSCFHRDLDTGSAPAPAASRGSVRARTDHRRSRARAPRGLLHRWLLADPQRIGEKVREEAEEVARAAASESDERLAEEAADVLYHLEVLLASRELPLAVALDTLNGRRR